MWYYKVVPIFKSVYETLVCDHSNTSYPVGQYTVLYKTDSVTLKSEDKTLV